MKPQRTAANDHGIDWDKVWSIYVQQSDAPPIEIEAANDNADDREPSRFWVALALIFVLAVGFACIGSIH